MTRNSEGNPWGLGEEDLRRLADLSRSRTASFREVLRAKIILDAASGKSLRSIARDRGLSRNTVAKTLHKILSMGPEAGLDDLFHRPGEGKVSAVERAFILGLARTPPGKAEGARTTGRWTILELTAYLREKGPALGYPSFATIGKSTVHRILKEKGVSLRSRREPSPDKRREILLFFREFALIVEDRERGGGSLLPGPPFGGLGPRVDPSETRLFLGGGGAGRGHRRGLRPPRTPLRSPGVPLPSGRVRLPVAGGSPSPVLLSCRPPVRP